MKERTVEVPENQVYFQCSILLREEENGQQVDHLSIMRARDGFDSTGKNCNMRLNDMHIDASLNHPLPFKQEYGSPIWNMRCKHHQKASTPAYGSQQK